MRKVRRALPSIKFTAMTIAICLAIGVLLAGGLYPPALFGLVFAISFLALVTLRNYDPMSWEAFHEPQTHLIRLQRDAAEECLRSIVDAFDNNGAISEEVDQARELLAERRPPTTAR